MLKSGGGIFGSARYFMNPSISNKIPGTAIVGKVVKIFAFAFALLFLSATAMAENPLPQKHHVNVPPAANLPAPGSWQTKAGPPNVYLSAPLLLSDGTVIFHNYGASDWWKLTPDDTGNYVTGAWSQIASLPSNYGPTYYASAVLPDGNVVVSGGEYNFLQLADTNLGAIYDPEANTWTNLPGWTGSIGDAESVVLPSGQFMIGSCCVAGQALLIENMLAWTPTGSGKADSDSEEALNLLPNGLVLTVDTQDCNNAELYNPSTGTWSDTGTTTVGCGGGREMGPAVLRADGTVVQFGAVTSGADPVSIYNVAGSVWTPAPNVPDINGTFYTLADAPAALMPNGSILFAASPGLYSNPTHYWEFDGTNYTQVPDTLSASSDSSFYINFLVLPNGQVLATDFSDAVAFYTPSSPPNQPGPIVSSVPTTITVGTSYTLTGTQLGGLTNGANYGDDYQSSTNYPIIAVVNNSTGHVFYAETYDWTVSVAPAAPGRTNFILPTAETGPSQLFVIANGVNSDPESVSIIAANSGSCGSSNGADLTSAPTSGLCSAGTASSVFGNGPWNWSCAGSNGGSTAQCSANLLINGSCGGSNGADLTGTPTSGLCTTGMASSVSGSGPWNWNCAGSNGGTTAQCFANLLINGSCGSANGMAVSTAPASGLCSAGTASSVSGSGPWDWSCAGSNGGTTASCSAQISSTSSISPDGSTITPGTGGSLVTSAGTWTFGTAQQSGEPGQYQILLNGATAWPAGQGYAAEMEVANGGKLYTYNSYVNGWWIWTGSAWSRSSAPSNAGVNGACGSSNDADLVSAPTSGLCSAGTASSVSGTGPWTWSCAGSNGGSTASCSAQLQQSQNAVNGVCGSANGGIFPSAPSSNLCSAGTASNVTHSFGSVHWVWTCGGTNGGSTSQCSASR
jgi:hypothetical protein